MSYYEKKKKKQLPQEMIYVIFKFWKKRRIEYAELRKLFFQNPESFFALKLVFYVKGKLRYSCRKYLYEIVSWNYIG